MKQEDSRNAAEHGKSDVEADPPPTTVEVLDSYGDLKLIAGIGPGRVIFRVCSRSLARLSSYWKNELYGSLSEGKRQHMADDWEITLPKSNPDGLRILLLAVHSNFTAIPEVLPHTTLFHTTSLCHEYHMVGLLKFFWRGWIAGLAKLNLDPMTLTQQLWIAHTVGDRGFYWNLCKKLLVSSWQWPNSTTLYLEGFAEIRLDHLGPLQSLGIMEQLNLGRRLLVNEVIGIFRFAMSNLTRPKPNRARCRSQESFEWKHTCDCAMLGALHRTLEGHQNYRDWYSLSEEESEKQILISVCQMVAELETIRTATIDASKMRRHAITHRDCTPWQQFTVKDILALHRVEDIVPIDEEYFKRQAEQSGINDARANIIQPATNIETEQSRMNSTPSFSAGA